MGFINNEKVHELHKYIWRPTGFPYIMRTHFILWQIFSHRPSYNYVNHTDDCQFQTENSKPTCNTLKYRIGTICMKKLVKTIEISHKIQWPTRTTCTGTVVSMILRPFLKPLFVLCAKSTKGFDKFWSDHWFK